MKMRTRLIAFVSICSTLLQLSSLLPAVAGVAGVAGLAAVAEHTDEQLSRKLNFPVYVWSNGTTPPQAVIIAIHGMTLHGRRFDTIAQHLADNNYCVVATDLRGFGDRQELPLNKDGRTAVHYKLSESDMMSLVRAAKTQYGATKVYCMGESLGANLAIDLAAKNPDLINGVMACSPCVKLTTDFSPRTIRDVVKAFIHPYRPISVKPYVADKLSEDKRVVESYLGDPLVRTTLSAPELLKSLGANKHALTSIGLLPSEMPLLIIAGEKDRIYDSHSLLSFVSKSSSHRTQLQIESNLGHLLIEHAFVKPEVLAAIDVWLAAQASTVATGGTQSQDGSADKPAAHGISQTSHAL